jgi:LPXTG-site transpeptidase (sortase) family protein
MQLKISLKRLLIITIVTGITFSLVVVLFLTFFLPGHVYSYQYERAPIYVAGLPVRLNIPKINVDAAIIPLGVTKNGAMDAPSGPKDVGWFKLGASPGNIGSAVIDGHYGHWKNGGGSVFDDLNKLRNGDELYVKDDKGVTITFIVRKILTYDQNGDTAGILSSNDGKSHLNLITCEGEWNNVQKTYSNRLVIFTDKE